MIVKVQKSLASSDSKIHFLVYNQDRSYFKIYRYNEELDNLMENGTRKYFEVQSFDGKLHFSHEVSQQNW